MMKPTASRRTAPATSRSAVVLGHQYALEAEEYAASGHLDRAEQLEQLASQCYLRALDDIGPLDKKTRVALKLIAENHEQRAVRWQMALAPSDVAPASPQLRPVFSSSPSFVAAPTKTQAPIAAPAVPSTSMHEVASEMEDLHERLKALGLSGYAPNAAARQSAASRQYLSSDLGDSFCLLPTGNRMPVVSRVDGETTLKAAYGNRSKNYRERYIGQLSTAPTSRLSIPTSIKEDETMSSPDKPLHEDDVLSTSPPPDAGHMEHLKATLAQQKHELARLTHTVKTLSAENAKLRQEAQDTAGLREENQRLAQSMESFKLEYNQKFLVLKRALEEWRRQQQRHEAKPAAMNIEDSQLVASLRAELDAAHASAQEKDAQLKKYEAWFTSLKASARAKQQTRGVDASGNRAGPSAFAAPSLPPRPPSAPQREL
ncbi:hypothetical protein ACHHYP_11763 [Achlya hypogyna]|uniref:Uncharacterized protein n=1 Tax=Achlya hypogyna TaxID=1202772 RepID=A0A1V9YIF5_ACHHY|nr:hypothetical protein ACHHYP_11763 [Achlya hypogyna]